MEWFQVAFLAAAVVLVAPAAWNIIRHRPDLALKSVAGWLGIAVILAYVFLYTGVGEWWEARHGGNSGFGAGSQTEELQPVPSDGGSSSSGY